MCWISALLLYVGNDLALQAAYREHLSVDSDGGPIRFGAAYIGSARIGQHKRGNDVNSAMSRQLHTNFLISEGIGIFFGKRCH